MGAIVPFPKREDAAFGPEDIQVMSKAVDDVCKALNLDGQTTAKEIVAIRIIELARRGELNPTNLRDRVLQEADSGTGL